MPGALIVFEGGEGAGKTTQARRLFTTLRAAGHDTVLTYEPGGTRTGRQLRTMLLTGDRIQPRAEALLYAADRAIHADTIIHPSMAAGAVVITDRFQDSSIAYQGFGRGLGWRPITVMSAWATGGLRPDLVVLLDIDPRLGLARAVSRGTTDRIEQERLHFHNRARAGFLHLAAQARRNPDRFGRYLVLDATRPADELAAEVAAAAQNILPAPAVPAVGMQ